MKGIAMKVRDIYDFINGFAPFSEAEAGDNSGLLVGDPDADVTGILLCLDVTGHEINRAREYGANLFISHHPLIFHPLRQLDAQSVAADCIRYGLNVISAHTNLDKAPGGVNDCLCDALRMTYEKVSASGTDGFLNVGMISAIDTPKKLAAHIHERLSASVRYLTGSHTVTKIAVCSGAGADLLQAAASLGCDAFVTGDAGYHDFLESESLGVSLFAAGHFETEHLFTTSLARKIAARFPSVPVFESDRKPPVITLN